MTVCGLSSEDEGSDDEDEEDEDDLDEEEEEEEEGEYDEEDYENYDGEEDEEDDGTYDEEDEEGDEEDYDDLADNVENTVQISDNKPALPPSSLFSQLKPSSVFDGGAAGGLFGPGAKVNPFETMTKNKHLFTQIKSFDAFIVSPTAENLVQVGQQALTSVCQVRIPPMTIKKVPIPLILAFPSTKNSTEHSWSTFWT